MKKSISLLLILVLTLSLLAGCRSGTTAEDMATKASEAMDKMIPEDGNGRVEDGDGFIGNDNGAMMPNG